MSERPLREHEMNGEDNARLVLTAPTRSDPAPFRGDSTRGRLASFCCWLIRRILKRLAVPLRVVLWNGEVIADADNPIATIHIHDRWVLFQLVCGLDPAFGEAYREGRIEVEGDLVAFLDAVFGVALMVPLWRLPGMSLLRQFTQRRNSTPTNSRSNVYHHYDVGNEFYRLWLDEQLVYTCAYFPDPSLTLEQAQIAKMDHVCRKLRLQPRQTVIEAGCGWGALALHMARHYGVHVTAYNLSHEQIEYARARAKAEGLDGQVRFVEGDYRKISGTCDAFVSVGMLEHVGRENYRRLGAIIHRCLKPSGIGLIHSIARNRPRPMSPWLSRHIFPGAFIPSLSEMMAVFEPYRFSVLDVENLRLHYAQTLAHWRTRFETVAARVRTMFDETFVRTWRLYLASSEASFTSGACQLFQIVFAPGSNNEVPWSRRHVYVTGPSERKGTDPHGNL